MLALDHAATMDHGTIASFMEITSCGSQTTIVRHLASCNWRIEAAIELYFTAGGAGDEVVPDPIPARSETLYNDNFATGDGDQVRAPIPARSETLYNDPYVARSSNGSYAAPASRSSTVSSIWAVMESPSERSVPAVPVEVPLDGDTGGKKEENINGRSDGEEEKDVVGADGGDAYGEEEEGYGHDDMGMEEEDYQEDNDDDYLMEEHDSDCDDDDMDAAFADQSPLQRREEKTLPDLFQPPYELMFGGSFHEAKVHAARQDRWLLINLQTSGVFTSHVHNRDLWSNEVIAQVIKSNFIFSLMAKTAAHGDEANKMCCYYKLDDDQLPAVLVLDPVTDQLLSKWCGSLQLDDLLAHIGKYTETKLGSLYKPRTIPTATTAVPKSSKYINNAQEPSAVVLLGLHTEESNEVL